MPWIPKNEGVKLLRSNVILKLLQSSIAYIIPVQRKDKKKKEVCTEFNPDIVFQTFSIPDVLKEDQWKSSAFSDYPTTQVLTPNL